MESVSEFAQRIKTKYPDYAEIPDEELVTRILDKHPDYRPMVDLGNPDNSGQAGGMGDVKMAESQAGAPPVPYKDPNFSGGFGQPNTHAAAMIPRFVGDAGKALSTGIVNAAAQGAQDNWGHPLDMLAGIAGDELKNIASPFHAFEHPIQSSSESLQRMGVANTPMAPPQTLGSYIPGYGSNYPGGDAPIMGLADQGGTIADMFTPVFGANILAKTLSYIPRVAAAAGEGAGVLNKLAGYTAGKATGAGEEALRYAGSPYGRARMEKWYGREDEIGADILNRLDNAGNNIPEAAQKNAILDQMPPMSVSPTIEKGIAALPEGVAGRGLAPHEVPGYQAAAGYIDYLRGGPAPPDLVQLADEAGVASQGARAAAVEKGSGAAQDAKIASQAERLATLSQSKAGKAAAGVGTARQNADEAFYSWDRREAQAAIPDALKEARQAAEKARVAAIDARAKAAVGDLSEGEAKAAEALADAADRNHQIAQVAARIKAGDKIQAIAKDFSAQGMPREDLGAILKAGKKRVESIPDLPSDEMSARELDRLRQKLDPAIDWVSDPEAAGIKDRVLKSMRSDISARMAQNAAASGNPEWSNIMRRFHDKLTSIDNMKDMIGKTGKVRERRIEAVVNNLFGKNKKWQQKFLNEFSANFGGNTVSRAKAAQMAQQFGEGGKPGILPVWGTGAGSTAATHAALFLPKVGATIATAGVASPYVAARITLPMLTKLEQGLKATGVALSPRAAQALSAMRRPISLAQRARLATVLAAELEAQMPANALPFRQKVAEEDQPVDYVTRR